MSNDHGCVPRGSLNLRPSTNGSSSPPLSDMVDILGYSQCFIRDPSSGQLVTRIFPCRCLVGNSPALAIGLVLMHNADVKRTVVVLDDDMRM